MIFYNKEYTPDFVIKRDTFSTQKEIFICIRKFTQVIVRSVIQIENAIMSVQFPLPLFSFIGHY